MSQEKGVLSRRGGMDSGTLLGRAVKEFGKDAVKPVMFLYGSKHNRYEVVAVARLLSHYGIDRPQRVCFDLSQVFGDFKSDLLMSGGSIPEGHYTDKSMSRTVVPGRNLIFASILAGYAESLGVPEVWLGVHAGDHAIYPDCRPSFVNCLNYVVNLSSEAKVAVKAPYLYLDKTAILKEGIALGVPYQLTRTCYSTDEVACGRCGSCQERLEAFRENGVEDPLEYQTRVIVPKE